MSADNWAVCPRCARRAEEVQLVSTYIDRTFREDYEFWGAEDGTVVADYSGECIQCGLSLSFRSTHEIPGVDDD